MFFLPSNLSQFQSSLPLIVAVLEYTTVVDPDFELRRGAGSILLGPAGFFSFSYFFLFSPKIT